MTQDPILELQNVIVEFGRECVLKNVNMKVYPHETIVIIGPSGAGKTVLLKTMAGIYKPNQGHVYCYGYEWHKLSIIEKHDLAKKIGVQFQRSALFDYLTAFENVAFPLREHGFYMHKGEESLLENRVMEVLEQVNLSNARNLFPHEMSGGMKQRLGIARALVLKPDILFLDDPTAGLDPVNSDQAAELILKLKSEIQATLIIVTHDILRAYQLAGRIFLIVNGELLETGSAEETRKHSDPRVQQFVHGKLQGPIRLE